MGLDKCRLLPTVPPASAIVVAAFSFLFSLLRLPDQMTWPMSFLVLFLLLK